MTVFSEIASANLLSPPVLFFILGLLASLAGAQLSLPEGANKMLAVYLILAIGFKGGAALSVGGAGAQLAWLLLAGVALSALMPLIGERLLRFISRLGPIERSAVAAHYGSVSIVTFVAAATALTTLGIHHDGAMVAVAAIMETPAILTALLLINRARASSAEGASNQVPASGIGSVLNEVFLNQTIVILLGALVVGLVSGQTGLRSVEPFLVAPFTGALCIFLLDLGAQAGRGLRTGWRDLTPGFLSFAVMMPMTGATLAGLFAGSIGLGVGNTALLMTLAASASYIAVPAAMRLAVPEARPAISLSLALGITFPLNILIGIPVYVILAKAISS
ncbi:sodium-dependent bicarbonate transport family permease [Ciceribacter selenitireducens]|uniref:Sodium-dependent bicarbonate transport family permease n=1 Tax=Ciceribacter selenitireducens ATCC BAA-1503 TaxID=1336235 RepID=A0A376AAV9_9HYPH|nr:sodium-dependent bicarbonate transport family permease [Ciceribacter selenitireducens]SSC64790.1 unnamed protein product [Ciceribacter selenitireducens ATCC BAA-1503]